MPSRRARRRIRRTAMTRFKWAIIVVCAFEVLCLVWINSVINGRGGW